jgi:uncharacterized protein (TIGR02594 family)
MAEPKWLVKARSYIGQKEFPGKPNNPLIVRWWRALKVSWIEDSVPWCGAFVGGVLAESGLPVAKGGASARAWLKYGVTIDRPAVGAIVVFWRGSKNGASGHVGFVVGKDKWGHLMVLGGNQGDAVNIKPFGVDRVLGYRWPSIYPLEERFTLPLLTSDGKPSQNEA